MQTETPPEDTRPWEALQRLLDTGDGRGVERFLAQLGPSETARAMSRLDRDEQTRLVLLLSPQNAADMLEDVTQAQAAALVEELPPEHAAAIVEEMASDRQADVLGELDAADAEAILRRMPPDEARDARLLLAHAPDTAGGLMIREFLAYDEQLPIRDVLDDLRGHGETYSDYEIQYAFAVDAHGRLTGVLRMHDLLFARAAQRVADVMIRAPLSVGVDASVEQLREFFDEHGFLGVPVTSGDGRLIGVVRRVAVQDAVDDRASSTFLSSMGIVGQDELRTMPILQRSSRRLSWLSINVVLNLIAASVIAAYQDTLAQAIVLAVFLPIISDMSGCSGNQAVAVTIRELTLGYIKPFELAYVFSKEVSIGLINGAVLGSLLGGAAYLWQANPYLGVVVGGALALNTVVAVGLGGLLPMVLRRLRFDPALASGPILTTVTDMCGFFILFSLATQVLAKLSP